MSSSPEFQRLVSLRTLPLARLAAAVCLSLLAAALLTAAVLACTAAAVVLLTPESAAAVEFRNLVPRLQSQRSIAIAAASATATFWLLHSLLNSLAFAVCESIAADIITRIRQHIHRKALRLEPADLTGTHADDAPKVFHASAEGLERHIAAWLAVLCTALPTLLLTAAAAAFVARHVAVQTAVPVILTAILIRRERNRHLAAEQLLDDQVNRSRQQMVQTLGKARIVSGFGMEELEHAQFDLQLAEYQQKRQSLRLQQRRSRLAAWLLLTAATGIPTLILSLQLSAGFSVFACLTLPAMLLILFRTTLLLASLPDHSSAGGELADEITAYLDRIPGVSQVAGAGFLNPLSRSLTLDQICWDAEDGRRILDGLDLRITLGERIALLSLQRLPACALASMIPRLIDPSSGRVLIDGRDIREGTLESLREEAIFVGGDDPVFDATVLENITCGRPDITKQQAVEAAKLVHADHFIRSLPGSYETALGEHGLQLDVGQRFRLSLARAAARQPALLIIEEPEAALDNDTKAMLDDAFQRLADDRTILFLPSRLSTVKRCSRIVVIHNGRVAADGTHEQLVRTSEIYRHWEYQRFHPFREDRELG
ncbi:MAG: ATP-binding cassette domain-containing protein [Planctomycetaceae bacterium]